MAPGTSWENKCWTSEGMAAIADRLNAFGPIILIGSELDRNIADKVIGQMSKPAVNTIGKFNLRELAVLLRKATFYLGGDTGPMHLAVAVGTRVVAWFGPTGASITGPYQKEAIIISLDLPCQPCYKRKCKHQKCLNGLNLEAVWEAIRPALNQ